MISDEIIAAWDQLRIACERVETSLPTQLSANVLDLQHQWRAFDRVLQLEARKK